MALSGMRIRDGLDYGLEGAAGMSKSYPVPDVRTVALISG